jgi:predicted hotdog family 3-hydroxylacyl-ACP dehydratase
MVMIDRLVSCEGQVARGTLKIRDHNVFVREGRLTECGMIEALAQTAAARTGWIAVNENGGGDNKVPVGVIGGIKDFNLFFLPEVDQQIETEIVVEHEFMNASVVQGFVRVKDIMACEVELKIFLT